MEGGDRLALILVAILVGFILGLVGLLTTLFVVILGAAFALFIANIIADIAANNRRLARLQAQAGGMQTAYNRELHALEEARRTMDLSAQLQAQATAADLVEHVLGPAEYAKFMEFGYVEMPSKHRKGHTLRIMRDAAHGVQLMEHGTPYAGEHNYMAGICILVNYEPPLPRDDQFLTLYLIAKYDERRIWNTGQVGWRN